MPPRRRVTGNHHDDQALTSEEILEPSDKQSRMSILLIEPDFIRIRDGQGNEFDAGRENLGMVLHDVALPFSHQLHGAAEIGTDEKDHSLDSRATLGRRRAPGRAALKQIFTSSL